MPKFCTTVVIAVALFCLFTLSLAGDSTENDESTTQVATIRLPTDTETESTLPLTKIRFRPVNRRFRVRSGHPCRHHYKFYPSTRVNREIPYGNDMLVADKTDFQEPVLHGEGRRIPGRWVRMHHHHHHDEDSDSDSDDEGFKKIVDMKLRKRFRSEGEEKMKKGGFMKRVRKFLDHYF